MQLQLNANAHFRFCFFRDVLIPKRALVSGWLSHPKVCWPIAMVRRRAPLMFRASLIIQMAASLAMDRYATAAALRHKFAPKQQPNQTKPTEQASKFLRPALIVGQYGLLSLSVCLSVCFAGLLMALLAIWPQLFSPSVHRSVELAR